MSKKYYLTIDKLPLQNWLDCNKGDLTATRLDSESGTQEDDLTHWETLYNDFIDKVGLSEEFNELMEETDRLTKLQLEYLKSRSRRLLNEINLLKASVARLKERISGSSGENNIYTTLVQLSRIQGHTLKVSDLTTLYYFELLKSVNSKKNG